jgi:glycine hydroxymethyltransferase
MVEPWVGLDAPDPLVRETFPEVTVRYLEAMDARLAKMSPRQIAARIKELSAADEYWRRRKCISLRAAEGIMGATSQSLLDSTLATRVSEGFPGDKSFPGIRGTDEYLDEVEATLIFQLRRLFGAKYVEWRPLSNSMANAMPYLVLTRPGDVVLAQSWIGGGANAANTPNGPGGLKDLVFLEMPFRDHYEHDVDGIRRLARKARPKIIVAGGGYVLFPYPLRELRSIADEVGAKLMYDAAHLAILIAGGVFQQPLQEGADVMTMSTHKAFGGADQRPGDCGAHHASDRQRLPADARCEQARRGVSCARRGDRVRCPMRRTDGEERAGIGGSARRSGLQADRA